MQPAASNSTGSPGPVSGGQPTPPASVPRSVQTLVGPLLIVLATLATYLPVLGGAFIWDDDTFLYNNPLIHARDGLYRFWFTTEAPDYFPLVSTTLWVEWRLWGMDARGYHVVNVLLHALGAMLLWRVLHHLAIPGAWLAALIFAIHPVNVESVAWITERKNTLPMVFYALTLLCYLRFERGRRWRWYGLSLVAFLLALLSKTSVVMLPVVLLGCAWWQRGRVTRVDLLRSMPFFIAALVFGLVTMWFQHYRAISGEVIRTDGFAARLALAGGAGWFYLYKALLPIRLCFVYPWWKVDASSWPAFLPGLAWVATFAILVGYRRTWSRPVLMALGYFVVTLLPVLGFVDIYFMRYSWVTDHWQYTAIVGVIALVVGWGHRATRNWGPTPRGLTSALVAGALVVLSWQRAGCFANEQTLYRDTLAKNPDAWMARYNLALLLMKAKTPSEQDVQAATEHLQAVLEMNPRYSDAHVALGLIALRQGRSDDALAHFQSALSLDPSYPTARYNLARELQRRGDYPEAIAAYRACLEQHPSFAPQAWSALASALAEMGAYAEAAEAAQRGLDQAHAQGLALLAERLTQQVHDYQTRPSRPAPGP